MKLVVDASGLSPDAQTLIVIGTAKAYKEHVAWLENTVIPKLRPTGRAVAVEESALKRTKVGPLGEIVSMVKPSPVSGGHTTHWIMRASSTDAGAFPSKPLRVALCVLPPMESVSRHNAPGNPILVTSLFKSNYKRTERTVVTVLCDSQDMLMSSVCAVARRVGVPYKATATVASPVLTRDAIVEAGAGVEFLFPNTFTLANSVREQWSSLADGIYLTRRLVDMPPNLLTPTTFVEQAFECAQSLGPQVSVSVIRGEELREQGYGGIYSVGKCSKDPPALVTLSYNPSPEMGAVDFPSPKSIALVGKGITYDTGGLSLKTKTGMPGMKRDMGGAAGILTAFCCAVEASRHRQSVHMAQLSQAGGQQASKPFQERPIHAVLCIAENSIGSNATRPDDIITLYSGKTVEINNTDAEGRLVLADGVASAVRHLNPEFIIDMATLTGAQGVATGKHFAAIYCNDEPFERAVVQAGRESGDLCHPMPYAPEIFVKEFSSKFADLKNSVKDRSNGQVSAAAQFIGESMGNFCKAGKWVHIDMAYPASDSSDDGATGYGTALLYTLLKQIDENERELHSAPTPLPPLVDLS